MHSYTLPVVLSLSLFLMEAAGYAESPVNTVNDGQIIPGSTFYNTADNMTTFRNSNGGGLWLKSGSTLRGLEVDSSGNLTNNGGAFHLLAPGSVVRIDGDINVRGLQNGGGAYTGNGGKVFVDSSYLFQSGNIYANGINGGLVQFNVGSMTIGRNAQIQAQGFGGHGGAVSLNTSGIVDIQRGSIINTSGKTVASFDTNVINIEGGLVNFEGTLIANGVHDRGGTIRLVSSGQSDLTDTHRGLEQGTRAGVFTGNEINTINTRQNTLKANFEGDIRIASASGSERQAIVVAQGNGSAIAGQHNDVADPISRAGDGGTIIITAERRILNGGWILADGAQGLPKADSSPTHGGNGGTISMNAGSEIITSGRIVSKGGQGSNTSIQPQGGKGGNGGLIAFSYKNGLSNTGPIIATGGRGGQGTNSAGQGGNGGLAVFSGSGNPEGNGGQVITYGGFGSSYGALGSVVAPNPATSSNQLIGVWRRTQPIELLTNAENILFLARSGGNNFSTLSANAQVRTIRNQAGDSPFQHGSAEGELFSKLDRHDQTGKPSYLTRNLVFTYLSPTSTGNLLTADTYLLNRGLGFQLSSLPYTTITMLAPQERLGLRLNEGQGTINYGVDDTFAGSRYSSISRHFSGVPGIAGGDAITGGNIHITATDSIGRWESFDFGSGQYGDLHGGSFIAKAGNRISDGFLVAWGGVRGGNMQLISQNSSIDNNLLVAPTISRIPGVTFGGSMTVLAPNSSLTNNRFQADDLYSEGFGGYLRLVAKGNITLGNMTRTNGGIGGGIQGIFTEGDIINNGEIMEADARTGRGGVVQLVTTGGSIINNGTIRANGVTRGGFISLTGNYIENNNRIEANGNQDGTVVINGPLVNRGTISPSYTHNP
jgi:hypothetical protein